jgi:hypothetical protein
MRAIDRHRIVRGVLFAGFAGAACVGTSSVHTGAFDSALSGPSFPGAGASGQDLPILAGFTPSSCGVAGANAGFGGGSMQVVGGYKQTCYYGAASSVTPMAFVEQVVETAQGQGLVHVRLTMNPAFVDNTYGTTAIGWGGSDAGAAPAGPPAAGPPMPGAAGPGASGPQPGGPGPGPAPGGHTFRDLYESDHAEFFLSDTTGQEVLGFDLDYISADTAAPSGYATLGVAGGDGKMLQGSASAIVYASTSIDRDLNACGYGSYTTSSPATDSSYTPNAATPRWDYRVVYDVWVSQATFTAGFGDATIPYVHASPSKTSATIPVKQGPCPPPTGSGGNGGSCVGEGCLDGGGSLDAGSSGGCAGEGCTDGGGSTRMCVGEVCEDGGFSCLETGTSCSTAAQCCSGFCQSFACVSPPL